MAFLSVGSDLVMNDFNRVADAFAVRVLIRLQMSQLVMPGATTTVAWQTVPLRNYQVQYKDNLEDPSWIPLSAPLAGNGAVLEVDAEINGQARRFYRLVVLP